MRRGAHPHPGHRAGDPRDPPEAEPSDDKPRQQPEKTEPQKLLLDRDANLHDKACSCGARFIEQSAVRFQRSAKELKSFKRAAEC